jgi:hypothetical protein
VADGSQDEISMAGTASMQRDQGPQTPPKSAQNWKRRVTIAAVIAVVLAAALVLPPLVNVSRYQRQVTALMARSMGRPVRMSAVELRLLPSPGFILHDLAVGEDPAFGAEPILSARTVIASVRLFSLWRGKLEISQVSVDEASLNLVRSPEGRWNLESLLMGTQPVSSNANGLTVESGDAKIAAHFPYLQATNSRVNFKNGPEKTPFSLAETDLSFWQDNPGQWRVRLLGQPVRTDMPMSLADTGELHMEASFQSAAQLRDMPMKLQLEWKAAQLGQLSRLILGSDAGWRGDVTADIEVQGTPEAAETKARLRATGVRREEFVPATSLDFDANCSFRYQHSQTAFQNIGCDTAIGDGRLHLRAELPGDQSRDQSRSQSGNQPGKSPEALLEVHQVSTQAALDLLRTVRSDFAPGIVAKGVIEGSLHYKKSDAPQPSAATVPARSHISKKVAARLPSSLESDLQGSLKITGAELSGGELKSPLKLPEIVLTPAVVRQVALAPQTGSSTAQAITIENRTKLVGLFTVPLSQTSAANSSAEPVSSPQIASVQLFLDQHGYQVQLTGAAQLDRLRELATGFGWQGSPATDAFHGGTADFALASEAAWIADANGDLALPEGQVAEQVTGQVAGQVAGASNWTASSISPGPQDQITLHHTEWQAGYLPYSVRFAQATLQHLNQHLSQQIQFAGDFAYGPKADLQNPKDAAKDTIRGNLTVSVDSDCKASDSDLTRQGQGAENASDDAQDACLPKMQLRFTALDAAVLQAALLPAPLKKSVFAPITDRLHSSDDPKLPTVLVNVQADSMVLGPISLQKMDLQLRSHRSEMQILGGSAQLLGGTAKGSGHIGWASGKPDYELDLTFAQINGNSLGTLLENGWSGGTLSGGGKISVAGTSPKELSGSADGKMHFDWQKAIIPASGEPMPGDFRSDLRLDRWQADANFSADKINLENNLASSGRQKLSAKGTVPFHGQATLTWTPAEAGSVSDPVKKTPSKP